ncbi:MAG: protein-L-isoaspartate(D-aspartate) O-methyltransferase [Terriglobales bacterium]
MNAAPQSGIGMTSARTRERLMQRLRAQGIRNPQVLNAIRSAPRHLFVDEALASRAYEDTALPIGFGQTISQPFIVARMTEALLADGIPDKVLEVGTGCGYQTLVLAGLVPQVFTVERLAVLQQRARRTLSTLGVRNVRFRHADGAGGWPRYAPYDGILVTAAPDEVPPKLLEQLAIGGRMIIPVGNGRAQQLLRIVRTDATHYARKVLDRVSFVPLLSGVE